MSEEQLGAALAYLEVLWVEACRRALETDAALAELDPGTPRIASTVLYDKATPLPRRRARTAPAPRRPGRRAQPPTRRAAPTLPRSR